MDWVFLVLGFSLTMSLRPRIYGDGKTKYLSGRSVFFFFSIFREEFFEGHTSHEDKLYIFEKLNLSTFE